MTLQDRTLGCLDRGQTDRVIASLATVGVGDGPVPWQLAVDSGTLLLKTRLTGLSQNAREALIRTGAALLNARLAVLEFGAYPLVETHLDAGMREMVTRFRSVAVATDRPADLLPRALPTAGVLRLRSEAGVSQLMTELRLAARLEQAWLATCDAPPLGSGKAALSPGGAASGETRSGVISAMVGTLGDTPFAWLHAGQATQRVVRAAADAGHRVVVDLQIGPSGRRAVVRQNLGGGIWPQVAITIRSVDHSSGRPPSCRRPGAPAAPSG